MNDQAARPEGPTPRRRPDRTAIAAHEIRGPLGVVGAVAELLLARELGAEERRLVELIRLAAAHALGVSEDLVAEASLGAGRLRVVPAPLSPAGLLRAVADLWTPMVADGARRLVVDVAPDCPETIVSDAGRLRQVLFNLVSNAAKAADGGTITLSVAPGAEGGRVVFTVADEGAGLPAGFAPEPFADPAERPVPGAGLGLWISARIAAALGGGLTLANRPEGGTVATLDLPAAAARRPRRRTRSPVPRPRRAPAAAAQQDEHAASAPPIEEPPMDHSDDGGPRAPRAAASPLAGRRALVVDDSAVSRMLLQTILASFAMRVDLAASGQEAERLARAAAPDVVLLDWSLADETGADVLDRLARCLGPAMPPVVSVSANARALLGGGAAVHVVKPFTPRELHEALETAAAGALMRSAAT